MELKLQLIAILASCVLLGIVFELLRRRRLIERYALIWLGSSLVLLCLAVWTGLLDGIADLMGIAYPPNALFMIAFGFVLLLLLHFSLAISRPLVGEVERITGHLGQAGHALRERNARVDRVLDVDVVARELAVGADDRTL